MTTPNRTLPTPADPLLWIKPAVKPVPEHGDIVAKAERGRLRATIEADCEWQAIHSTARWHYRWRVFYGEREIATDCATTVGFCMQKAAQFVADWPKYPAEAQRAMVGKSRGD